MVKIVKILRFGFLVQNRSVPATMKHFLESDHREHWGLMCLMSRCNWFRTGALGGDNNVP